jgi:DNA-binding MarR family transcriptional regulator
MPDVFSAAPALFLREAELRRGIELLYFGYRDFTSGPDALLEAQSLGRAHHRALYFISRQPGLIVSDLLRYLKITKQSLARVLNDLQGRGLLDVRTGARDRRQRQLFLTSEGAALERALFEALRATMQRAYSAAGAQAVGGFWQVLLLLVDPAERAAVEKLVTTEAG